ncbi:FAD-binding domain-containing protein [Streptomyces sp. TRM 70351]|uniref:FAD-binding domain-containing protein n=1 Tax=Streptomyces sp. TRM 70351 TaxID=3116552 RepID=UPI003FCD0D9B
MTTRAPRAGSPPVPPVSIVLFTSDLRVHDHPPLHAALARSDAVVPLFVTDSGIHRAGYDAPNRSAFLADCLAGLDASLRARGGRRVHAGTGTDTRPNRVLNPLSQARRFDPDGVYVRRWVPELAGVPGRAVHEPWRLPESGRAALDYPGPVVGLSEGLARFRQARGLD